MKQETNEIFKEALESKGYIPYASEESMRLLGEACVDVLKNEGAIWYYDFHKPLTETIRKLYEKGRFLVSSPVRKTGYYSSEERRLKILDDKLKSVAINQLWKLKGMESQNYTISSVKNFFNNYLGLGQNDRLNFDFGLSDDADTEEVRNIFEKLKWLNNKRALGSKNKHSKARLISKDLENVTLEEFLKRDYFGIGNVRHYWSQGVYGEISLTYQDVLRNSVLLYSCNKEAEKFLKKFVNFSIVEARNMIVKLR